MNKNALVIINPHSGQQKANKVLTEIIETLNDGGYRCEVFVTTPENNAKYAVERFCNDKSVVVCCGGDGTFNEVLSGLLSSGCDIPIGYIPCGSTNDFATGLGLSKDLLTATKDIVNGEIVSVDAGIFNGRVFSYVASCGIFTETSYSTPTDLKNLLGHTAYILEGVKSLLSIKPIHLNIVIEDDEKYDDDYIFMAICNSTTLGGVLKLDEKIVDLNDGLFETVLIKSPQNMADVTKILHYINTKNYDNELIKVISAKNISVTSSEKINWSLDGEEEEGVESAEIENIKSAFRIFINK